tara:strand:- start:70 stop:276 length:207 start_codon:yes stop_codon:yes gene_type:complete
MGKNMKNFTVWFRVGLDFKETIEAEDARDAERRIGDKVDEEFREYLIRILESYTTHIYDVVEEADENS